MLLYVNWQLGNWHKYADTLAIAIIVKNKLSFILDLGVSCSLPEFVKLATANLLSSK